MLEIHFLGVTTGECTIVRTRGRLTVIDINTDAPDGQPSALTYLDTHFPAENIHRYIQAHVDHGHMRGLHALFARRAVKYAWFPFESDGYPYRPHDGEHLDWECFDRLRKGKQAGTQTLFPVAERDREVLDRFDLEGWSIVVPYRHMADLYRAADGYVPPPNFILALTYGGVRVLLSGETGQWLWRDALRRCRDAVFCNILSATHRKCQGDELHPYLPALDLLRPAQVVVSADSDSRDEIRALYHSHGADIVWRELGSALVLRIEADGTTQFSVQQWA